MENKICKKTDSWKDSREFALTIFSEKKVNQALEDLFTKENFNLCEATSFKRLIIEILFEKKCVPNIERNKHFYLAQEFVAKNICEVSCFNLQKSLFCFEKKYTAIEKEVFDRNCFFVFESLISSSTISHVFSRLQ